MSPFHTDVHTHGGKKEPKPVDGRLGDGSLVKESSLKVGVAGVRVEEASEQEGKMAVFHHGMSKT